MATVLVVDDEFGIGELLDGILTDEGHHVMVAADGSEALDRLHEGKVDLVLSDLMMPVMDGAALLRALRADSAHRDVPFVLMCALPEEAIRDRIDGYDAFIRKPFRIQTMLDVLGRLIGPPAR